MIIIQSNQDVSLMANT